MEKKRLYDMQGNQTFRAKLLYNLYYMIILKDKNRNTES